MPYTVGSLAYHTALVSPDPRNVIQVVLNGVHPPEGAVGAIMPAFAGMLDDQQVADLVAYLRARFSDAPPWTNIERTVREIRQGQGSPAASRPAGAQAAPSSH